MKVSRRDFVKSSTSAAFFSLASQHMPAILRPPRLLLPRQAQSSGQNGVPRFVVQDFDRHLDSAYLSNGLIGIRPGPNPLAKARTYVSGFVYAEIPYEVQGLSPAPYPLETDLMVNRVSLLRYPNLVKIQRQTLDMSNGELLTEMTFAPENGITLQLQVLQFASRSVPSVLCQEIRVNSSNDAEVQLELRIDHEAVPGRVYTDSAPQRTNIDLVSGFESHGQLSKLGVALHAVTPDGQVQKQDPLATDSGITRAYSVKLVAGRPFRFQTLAAMVSDLYHPEPPLEAIRLARWAGVIGFDELREDNRKEWSELWQSRVRVVGDPDSQRVLDAAFFYLHSSLHSSTRTGMPPFGLSNTAYYGHSFWDTESWSLLPVTLTAPETAHSLVEYRLRGLPSAKRLAALYGYRGAQFPWEAAPTSGFETTPTFADTGWIEQHVTPDVALGCWEYQLATNDQDFLKEGTWPVLQAVAAWIESRGIRTSRGFEIQHIMGTDEGLSDLKNDSYMNLISKMVLTAAIRCAELAGEKSPASWSKIRDRLVIPIDASINVVLPYDQSQASTRRYSSGHMDFLIVHDPPLDSALLRNTYKYEESLRARSNLPNTTIGFAAAAVAATAAFVGDKRRAAELFAESWKNVWLEPFGMIREGPSQDYGCFLTNFGSLLQTAMLGFTGIRINEGDWAKYPASLPRGWSRIEMDRIWVKGEPKRLIANDGAPARLLD